MSGEQVTAPQAFVTYSDATYDYYCEAGPRTILTAAAWRIARINKTSLREQWAADTAGNINQNVATDLATVAALDFA